MNGSLKLFLYVTNGINLSEHIKSLWIIGGRERGVGHVTAETDPVNDRVEFCKIVQKAPGSYMQPPEPRPLARMHPDSQHFWP